MSDLKLYAVNETSAVNYVKTYFDGCTFNLGSSRCACGESSTLFVHHSTGKVTRIIICEACFMEATLHDRTLVYFDEDVTRDILESRYRKAVEDDDFVVVGDQAYNPETIREILDHSLAIM